MGSHIWAGKCPYCGFEDMVVSAYNSFDFEIACQICGYSKWTEEKVPDSIEIKLARQALEEMGAEEKKKVIEQYYKDNIPLVVRIKGKFPNED